MKPSFISLHYVRWKLDQDLSEINVSALAVLLSTHITVKSTFSSSFRVWDKSQR